MGNEFDRSAEDLGNVVSLEHVNVRIADQRIATIFYVTGIGLTRDPYRMTGVDNMWVNIGQSQFHMPTGKPEVLRGHVGLVIPDREALLARLTQLKGDLDGTRYSCTEADDYVELVSPWGNRLRCFEPDDSFGNISLGMPYVEFDVPVGAAAPIARYYREILGTKSDVGEDADGPFAKCSVGYHQDLIFRETDRPIPEYDGHHVQVYVCDFSGPHQKLKERGLIFEESSQWQYRIKDIVDLDTGKLVYTIEHEVRCMTHPMFRRPLVNRSSDQSVATFSAGHEDWSWTPARVS